MNALHKMFSACEEYKQDTLHFQKKDLLFALAVYAFLILTYYAMGSYFYMLGENLTKKTFYTVELLQILSSLFLIFIFCRLRKQSFWQSASLGQLRHSLVWGIIIAAVSFVVIGFLSSWIFNYNSKTALIRFFYYLFYISFSEEFIFRGYIGKRFYGVIQNKFFAVSLVAVLFSLIHIPFQMAYFGMDLLSYISTAWGNLLFCFVAHVFFQWMYARFNSIALPCIVHCFWDFVQDLFL